MNGVRIQRDLSEGRHPLTRLATGLDASRALLRHCGGGAALRALLARAEVAIAPEEGYMWVDDEEGCIVVSRPYLRSAEKAYLYLDLVHEVVHLQQLALGRELFDRRYPYDQRPTELEAYRVTVEEARRLGLSDAFLREYLHVEWISEAQHARLLQALGVPPTPGSARA